MKNNATSGLPLPICVSVCALMVLLFITDTAYAKRGCSAFGHSCFGGHGKRFDPHARENVLQENQVDTATSDKHEEMETLRLPNEFVIPEKKFEGQEETAFSQTRRQDSTRFDPFMLSFIVRQWLTSHHRLHQPDVELNKK
ncbi:hypothetical protein WN51_10841 [Melipona quadrifasciata]|uniref:Neuropeptide CCHamide-2 n=1 Tax=Melipona quadrifasciata TaxID=166423 RepID=A0A0M9A4T0_9HYME|nr:hypothetical protein WN51_10841 [Melipona quadrifasciata]